jgi:uncharacterized RDD family membrane protein YckC
MPYQENHPIHDDHHEVTIETLRTPPLHIQPAPTGQRIVAALIDSLIAGVVLALIIVLIHQTFSDALVVGAEFLAATFVYYFVLEATFASTVGKNLLGLRVVGNSGDPVSTREAFVRNLLRTIDWLPILYLVGALAMILSAKKQRVGDIMAGTVVTIVAKKEATPPPAPFLFH